MEQEWTEDVILSYIANQTKEHIGLDYKQSDSLQHTEGKKKEISKDVSAFANSAGGTIIYGVEEQLNLPVKIDGGLDPAAITREWLEQVINSNIQQRIDGVRIHQVDLPKTNPGQVAYVVGIPQATTRAPHQAADKRYYRRFNFQSIAMEDYEIRDILRRAESPELFLELTLQNEWVPIPPNFQAASSGAILLNVAVGNRAVEPAEHAILEIYLDRRIEVGKHQNWTDIGSTTITTDDLSPTVSVLRRSYGYPQQLPIFAGYLQPLEGLVNFTVSQESSFASGVKYYLGWSIRAPHMTEQRGRMWLWATNGSIRILPM